jgi:hypothetical protein
MFVEKIYLYDDEYIVHFKFGKNEVGAIREDIPNIFDEVRMNDVTVYQI